MKLADNDDAGLTDHQQDQIRALQQKFKWGSAQVALIAKAVKAPEEQVAGFLAPPPPRPDLHLVRPDVEQASNTPTLALYDAARNVLAAMVRVDEVKTIHDQAVAMQVYAQHAQDTTLLDYATEYRVLAEIRAGEILRGMAKANGGQVGGRQKIDGSRETPSNRPPTLKELGITQSSRWQKLADLSPAAREAYATDVKKKQNQAMTAAQRKASRDRHFWLTPPDLMAELEREFGPFDYDPCPYPRPEGFDGLKEEWGQSSYVNPMFQGGMTAWVKKAIAEHQKGKDVVIVFPLDGWVHMLLRAGATIRPLGDVKWLATEDGTPGTGIGREIAAFILQGRKAKKSKPR